MDPISIIVAALPLVLKYAPRLIGLFAGPTAGTAAGQVLDAAKDTFGTIEHDKIELAIQQDRSLLEKFQANLDAHTKETQAYLADVQSARAMQTAAIQSGSRVQWFPVIVGAIIFAIFFFTMYAVFSGAVNDRSINQGMMVGCAISLVTMVAQFFFGSSKGSDEKNGIFAQLMAGMQQQNTTLSNKVADAAVTQTTGRMFR